MSDSQRWFGPVRHSTKLCEDKIWGQFSVPSGLRSSFSMNVSAEWQESSSDSFFVADHFSPTSQRQSCAEQTSSVYSQKLTPTSEILDDCCRLRCTCTRDAYVR
ncbi:hypothetical protein F2P81_019517 [Scophthalmus maximus]|uniref:Uncharacterized protein n=1 Tax=Scophthalmus maximus TaxID=52904 RepID=A0A6A4S9W9_SCOMX|nr:hypothetical protein F2P81_019517 [Scophthalmus maximus]